MHTYHVATIKRKTTPSVGKAMKQPKLSYIGNKCVNWYNHFGKLFRFIYLSLP